jgi:hypothetical protein
LYRSQADLILLLRHLREEAGSVNSIPGQNRSVQSAEKILQWTADQDKTTSAFYIKEDPGGSLSAGA